MNCEVAFPPELGLDPADFADLWNESSACRRMARARTAQAGEATSGEACAILEDVEAVTDSSELARLVQHIVRQQGADGPLKVAMAERPDRGWLVTVRAAGH